MFNAWKKFTTRRPGAGAEPVEVIPLLNRSMQYRRFLRSVFQSSARLNLAGSMREVQLLDVSLKGALVDTGVMRPCEVGGRGRLRLLLSPTTFIAMDVAVTRVHGSQLGRHSVEGLFSRLANAVEGGSAAGLPDGAEFIGSLLILRELLHHLDIAAITLVSPAT